MAFGDLIDRALVKIVRNPSESDMLRRRFAQRHDLQIGKYTIGAFDRWRLSAGTRIGRYCSIASSARIVDANHPTDALSTHPAFYLKSMGLVPADRVHAEPTVLEDDVWLGHNAIITPGCKTVGRGAIVGAGAVVMKDVPRYAVMAGAPARIVRYRFSPETIAAIEATRWWELDKEALAAATRDVPEFLTAPTVDSAQAFLKALGRPAFVPVPGEPAPQLSAKVAIDRTTLTDLIRGEIPDFTEGQLATPLTELPIDSFGLINLRIMIEQAIGAQISDATWSRIVTPQDLLAAGGSGGAAVARSAPSAAPVEPVVTQTAGAVERRSYALNMPQMALRGLSEPWLFKEIGDIHWSNITRGLGTSSAAIADDTGDRLYATFTRFRLESGIPLSGFRENDRFQIEMAASRLGAGMFFGDATLQAPTGSLRAQVMTSFSKFGEHGANTSLLKGQPQIPDDCPIPALAEMPPFGLEYRARRSATRSAPLFETEYAIQPPHDINGVGLLYFAAYPMIAELGAIRHGGNRVAMEFSTTVRDICYFANCGPDETLIYRAHRWDETEDGLTIEATLSRSSDGTTMAFIATEKARIA